MTIPKQKVYAYITHHGRLLVFSHPQHPEAGLQVPGGTLEPGEDPSAGALREAIEETGLSDLRVVSKLGEQIIDLAPYGLAQVHQRHFFHLALDGEPPERWQHYENIPSDGSAPGILFEFFWVEYPEGVPQLIAELDGLIGRLRT